MRDLKKNLIYWGWNLEKITLFMFAWILFMWGLLTFMEGGSFAESAAQELWIYLCMAVFISSVSNAFNSVTHSFPFTVSMGSTRKASFIAMQLIQHLILLEYAVLAGVICRFIGENAFEIFMQYLFAIIGAVLLLQAFVNVTCAVCARFGNKVAVMVYILFAVLVFAGAMYVLLSGKVVTEDLGNRLITFVKKPYLPIAGAVLDVTAAEVYYNFLKKKDLRI